MKRLLPYIALSLFVGQMLLMLVSWLLSAAFPVSSIRSLLSGGGLRWLLGHYADALASPVLVWLVLGALAYGCLRKSCLLQFGNTYRESRARLLTLILLVAYTVVMLLFTVTPHAVLLSVTGDLWPSPFSASLVPVMAFVVMSLSVFYGVVAGRLSTLHSIYDAMLYGVGQCAPLLLFYVLFMQIYESLKFVFPENPYF